MKLGAWDCVVMRVEWCLWISLVAKLICSCYDVLMFEVGRPDMLADKHYGKGEKEAGVKGDEGGEQTYSMRKRMSAFPRVDTDVPEPSNIDVANHFPQNQGLGPLAGTFRYPWSWSWQFWGSI